MSSTRRDFIKKTAGASAILAAGTTLPGMSAESYNRIKGANERIRIAISGVNARGSSLAKSFSSQPDCEIVHICDVDSRAKGKCIDMLEKAGKSKPRAFEDIRKSLEDKEVDAMVIAMPDHWHAPAALMAMQAGKHVYLEKPCSHNPAEGEIIVAASQKYHKCVQLGTQRRSFPNIIEAMTELHNGIIGRVYFGKGWYGRNRKPIGVGKVAAPPDWLNWDLWQGPAPRKEFKDNIVHYDWHWRWHWGTGEALNNGTHMVDLLRWGLNVEYPIRVSSSGGRYHFSGDDWETPDTQVITWDFDNNSSMTWEGMSCNKRGQEGQSVGALFFGENGSLSTGDNSYIVKDLNGKEIKKVDSTGVKVNALDSKNPTGNLDILHIRNLFDGIREGKQLNAAVDCGHKSTLLVQLGNIAHRTGSSLNIDPKNGHIVNNTAAQKLWSRNYETGWEMKL